MAAAALLMVSAIDVSAQSSRSGRPTPSGAETSLVGIRLFDSGVRVVQVYGTPDDIQGVNVEAGTQTGGGAGGGRGGDSPLPGGPGDSGEAGARGGGGRAGLGRSISPSGFGFADDMVRQARPGGTASGGGLSASDGAPGAGGGGAALPGGGGPGAGGGAGAPTERVTYTRWIYNRGGSKYGFVLDKFNRVVQIEAIGLQNAKVRTRAGIGFGATFAQIMRRYQTPDGYEIGGNTIVVRYLTKRRVAFRLNRLEEKKPHVVTGIVVAAGK